MSGVHFDSTYSPVAQATSVRLLLAIAATLKLELRAVDFKTAFLNANRKLSNKAVYFRPPTGVPVKPSHIWLLQKAMHGLPDSSLLWHKMLTASLKKLGFRQTDSDPCVLYRFNQGEYVIMTLTVDDVLIASRSKKTADKIIAELSKQYELTDMGVPQYVLVLHINYNRKKGVLQLGQKLYIESMAEKYGQTNANPVYNPGEATARLSREADSPDCTKDYRGLSGSLIYAVHTRPDIVVPVSNLAKFLNDPNKVH